MPASGATLLVVAITLLIPFTPQSGMLGFAPLPVTIFGILVLRLIAYLALVEQTMRRF
jgi:Mg2+-importing ATPase